MKKSLKLLMAIVLFIAVIAIANCVSAASVTLDKSNTTVAEDSSVRTVKLNEDPGNNEIIVGSDYSNIILDLTETKEKAPISGAINKITIYATGVRVKLAHGVTTVVVAKSGELVIDDDSSFLGDITTLENKGTVKLTRAGVFGGTWTNEGTLEIAGTVNNVTMKAGSLHVVKGGNVTVSSMEDGVISVDKDGVLARMDANTFKGGYIESAATLAGFTQAIEDKDKYVFFSTKNEDGEETSWFIAPKADLQVAVKFMDVTTGKYVTNLEADKVYQVEATVVYKGSECVKDPAWTTAEFTSKTEDVLMPTTENTTTRVKALKDGKAILKVVFDKDGSAKLEREVEVTVGKVEEEPTNPENPENKPAENNKDLDKTPKTGDYIEIAAANAHSSCYKQMLGKDASMLMDLFC